jgi:hypothetical protein
MKITIEFPNGSTLVLAPEQLNLAQLNAEQIALTGRAGDYSIPIVSFPGSLATTEEIAARVAPKSEAVAEYVSEYDGLCHAETGMYQCSLAAGHEGDHKAYAGHDPALRLLGTKERTA